MYNLFAEHLQIDWITQDHQSLLQINSDVIYSLRFEYKVWTQEKAQKTWNAN